MIGGRALLASPAGAGIVNAQASETTAESIASAVTDPALIQPGVRRFLRGLGLLG